MIKHILLIALVIVSAVHGYAWTDGELLIWTTDNRGYRALAELGRKFEEDMGIPVKVEIQNEILEKGRMAAQSGKGPDIFFWAHDIIGEWADSGLLEPVQPSEEYMKTLIPISWNAVKHNGKLWGYPVALECVSLIYNKKLVTGQPPTQLADFSEFARKLKEKNPKLIAIMWDYTNPYLSWPFLASAGAYSFKQTKNGWDSSDSGVDAPGAVEGLTAIENLIKQDVLPKGSTMSVADEKMIAGELATMINGPWSWANLHKGGVDFALAAVPGVDGKPGKPFVGVLTAFINRSSPNSDLAVSFLEKYVITADGLRKVDADAPLGVPSVQSLAEEMSAKSPLIKVTYENAKNGEVMPNIPQMGRFFMSMGAAFKIATSEMVTPEEAIEDAAKNMANPGKSL
jgi:maltose/maltodextrin transport system substrate-binding protein